MLISFSVTNFRSIRSRCELSFISTSDETQSESLVTRGNHRLLRCAAIYGPNASGKSNLLKALSGARDFVVHSATRLTLGDQIPGIIPFRLDPDRVGRPSTFEFTVEIEEHIYEYKFSATADHVHHESLYVKKPGGRQTKRFSRDLDPETGETRWNWRGLSKRDATLLEEKTRLNGLALSRAAELNFENLGSLFLWFKNSVLYFDFSEPTPNLITATARKILRDDAFRERVLNLLRDADMGISDLAVREKELTFDKMPEELRSLLEVVSKKSKSKLSEYSVSTTHYDIDGNPLSFSLHSEESNGTQRFFAIAGVLLSALSNGSLLVIDELDCSMHPNLTRKIVELFNSPRVNQLGAQLLFSTHDVSLFDSSLLRRDQLWLTEKKESGETDLFSLYDVGNSDEKPRKNEAFLRNYLFGRYGATPNFGPLLEDMESEWVPIAEKNDEK